MRPSHLSPKQIFDYACMDAETLYQKLGVSPAGFSQEEAEKSRAQHGKNSGPGRKSDTVLHRLRRAFVNPFAVILLVLASISLVTDVFDQGAHSIAWVLIRFMAVLIPVVFVACGLTQGNWFSAFLFALSVTVGLTPEIAMVITACLAKGSGAMGEKADCGEKHQRHAGIWQHGYFVCGQNRHFDRRPYFPGILYGHPGE